MSANRGERRRADRERRRVGDYEMTRGPTVPVPERQTHAAQLPNLAPGEHLWIMAGVWRIEHPETAHDPGVQKFLDLENLLTIEGPGCFVCEQVWSADVAAQPCPGEPSAP